MRVKISITSGPAKGQRFTFDKPDRFLFGRAVDARVSLPNDPYVSRRHFLLEISPPDCKVTDLDSKNGLFVNGVRYGGRKPPGKTIKQAPNGLKEAQLKDGDEIVVGDTRMRVSIQSSSPQQMKDRDATLSHIPRPKSSQEASTPAGLLDKLLKEAVIKKSTSNFPDIKGYQIENMIDRGGMGIVYKATELKTGKYVAIKVMLPHMATDPENVLSFQREIDLTRQLKHSNIVQLFDHGKTEETFYFVLEFVNGMNLYQFLESRNNSLSLEEVAPIMIGTLNGLRYAHHATITMEITPGKTNQFTGIVHRDLKPQNILLGRKGNQWIPKISDFGISKSFESAGFTNITKPGDVLGTPMYWPREQITHYKYLNPVTDVFSIAAVFYELLTGKWVREGFETLFEKCKQQRRPAAISEYMNVIVNNPSIPIRKRNPTIPEPIANVIDRALREAEVPYDEKKMREALAKLRYPDARVFHDAMIRAFKEIGFSEKGVKIPKSDEQLPHPDQSKPLPSGAGGNAQTFTEAGENQLQYPSGEQMAKSSREKVMPEPAPDGTVFFSILRPASSGEVALLVFDLEESSEYLREVGDTYFSNMMVSLYRRVKKHRSTSDLIFMKSTGDGFLAVYNTISAAFSLASAFLKSEIRPNVHARMALHWGTVKIGPDRDVLGAEVHRVFRIEHVQLKDQIDPTYETLLPVSKRILITKQGFDQLDNATREKFTYAGKFLLKGFDDLCELWVLHT